MTVTIAASHRIATAKKRGDNVLFPIETECMIASVLVPADRLGRPTPSSYPGGLTGQPNPVVKPGTPITAETNETIAVAGRDLSITPPMSTYGIKRVCGDITLDVRLGHFATTGVTAANRKSSPLRACAPVDSLIFRSP